MLRPVDPQPHRRTISGIGGIDEMMSGFCNELKVKKQSMIRLAAIAPVSMGTSAVASAQAYAQTDVANAQGQPGGNASVTQVAGLQDAVAGVQRGVAESHAPAVVSGQHAKGAPDAATNARVGPVSFCTVFFGN
ncbi:hypothetical protein [Paraburkholderia sacchari]|uniref:hypothetical protein n=1 Tax=Paraburkholderia sacchari TaxID=159450 RepID=UPI001BCD947B|nr:hypothetical protein [Paraburkholderia sacchari]